MAAAPPKPQQIGFSGDLGGFGLNGMGMSINNKLKQNNYQNQQQKQLPPIAPAAQQRQSTIGTTHSQNLAPGIAQKPVFLDSQGNYNFSNKPGAQSLQPGQGLYFNDKDGDFASKIKMKS
jgi:hypothetical protein